MAGLLDLALRRLSGRPRQILSAGRARGSSTSAPSPIRAKDRTCVRARPPSARRPAPERVHKPSKRRTSGMTALAISFDDIEGAERRIAGVARRTPILTSTAADEASGAKLFFKCRRTSSAPERSSSPSAVQRASFAIHAGAARARRRCVFIWAITPRRSPCRPACSRREGGHRDADRRSGDQVGRDARLRRGSDALRPCTRRIAEAERPRRLRQKRRLRL